MRRGHVGAVLRGQDGEAHGAVRGHGQRALVGQAPAGGRGVALGGGEQHPRAVPLLRVGGGVAPGLRDKELRVNQV